MSPTDDPAVRSVVAVHRRGGTDVVLGALTLAADAPVELTVRARGADFDLLAGPAGAVPRTVATADGRTLDSVATGGFLGLWIGVYATSNGRPTSTTLDVERFEYLLVDRVTTG